MATTANAVRIDLRERDKTLSCKETLVLGSTCAFTFYRDGAPLADSGYAILRIPKGRFPASPDGPYGLGAFPFADGASDETDILKDAWLVNVLRWLPVGTVTQLSMTVVTAEGVCAEGSLDILVATVAEITTPDLHDPEERIAMFEGQRGKPGVELVAGEPSTSMDPSIRVAVNVKGVPEKLREVPPCPEMSERPTTFDTVYVLAALPGGKYEWRLLPLPTIVYPNLGDLPGRIAMRKTKDDPPTWSLVQTTMRWRGSGYQEDENAYAASIATIDHVDDHSDGVL